MTTKLTSTPEYNSLKYVMGKWSEILAKETEMTTNSGDDSYYELQKDLNNLLVAFLRLNFSYLSTRQVFKLCGLVQAHRPVQLHSFLITCENLA